MFHLLIPRLSHYCVSGGREEGEEEYDPLSPIFDDFERSDFSRPMDEVIAEEPVGVEAGTNIEAVVDSGAGPDTGERVGDPGTSNIGDRSFIWWELNDSEFLSPLIVSMLLTFLEKLQEAVLSNKAVEPSAATEGEFDFLLLRILGFSFFYFNTLIHCRCFSGGFRREGSLP